MVEFNSASPKAYVLRRVDTWKLHGMVDLHSYPVYSKRGSNSESTCTCGPNSKISSLYSVVLCGNFSYPNSNNWKKILPSFYPDPVQYSGPQETKVKPQAVRQHNEI